MLAYIVTRLLLLFQMSKEAKGPQAESVKVYVRVRPFLQKKLVSEAKFENGRDNIVTMEGARLRRHRPPAFHCGAPT